MIKGEVWLPLGRECWCWNFFFFLTLTKMSPQRQCGALTVRWSNASQRPVSRKPVIALQRFTGCVPPPPLFHVPGQDLPRRTPTPTPTPQRCWHCGVLLRHYSTGLKKLVTSTRTPFLRYVFACVCVRVFAVRVCVFRLRVCLE